MRNTTMALWIAALCGTLALGATAAPAADANWKELARHKLGGAGGWDLLVVDADASRVYVTRGDRLLVVDADSGKSLGEIDGLKRAHGVALVPALRRGYVSSGGDDKVIAFDLGTRKRLADIATGKNPDAMLYDTASKHVFSFNGKSNDASVIDPKSNEVVATIALPGKPELAASDEKGTVFVNLEDKNQIAALDVKANSVRAVWSLGTCEEPSGLALDAAHRRLFAVCSNKQMAVLDADKGNVVATVAIGDGPDGAAFDPHSGNAFSSNSDGTLTVVHEDDPTHFRVLATVTTPARTRTIALDSNTHRLWLPMAEFGTAPAPTAEEPHPRPPMQPDSFGLLVVGQP
jgi:YVTN family beta-propeller protein